MDIYSNVKVRDMLAIIDPAAYVVICDGETPIAGGRLMDAKTHLFRSYGHFEVFRVETEHDDIVLTIYR